MVFKSWPYAVIIGLEKGWFKEESLEIEMIEPKEHFDALDEIENGTMDIAITEPIHLVQIEQITKMWLVLPDISTRMVALCITKIKTSHDLKI